MTNTITADANTAPRTVSVFAPLAVAPEKGLFPMSFKTPAGYYVEVSGGGPIEAGSTPAGTSATHAPTAYAVGGFGTLWFQTGHTGTRSFERWSFSFHEDLRIPVTGEEIRSTWIHGWWGYIPQPKFLADLKDAIKRVLLDAIKK